jgi:predicted amidohydrolase
MGDRATLLRIAGVQFIGNADKETNIRTAERMVREAAGRGAPLRVHYE